LIISILGGEVCDFDYLGSRLNEVALVLLAGFEGVPRKIQKILGLEVMELMRKDPPLRWVESMEGI
jgi:hypothetical protein